MAFINQMLNLIKMEYNINPYFLGTPNFILIM